MEVPSVFDFILLALASFRLTRLVIFDKITEFIRRPFFVEWTEVNEDGEEETYIRPKEKGIQSWIGELLSCYWCMGVWSSIGLYGGFIFFPSIFQPIIVIFAIAGLAAFIETLVHAIQRQ